MARFLLTSGNSSSIEQIVVEAKQTLVLVTPYLKLSNNLLQRLIDADRKRVQITIVYGKTELVDAEKAKLNKLSNLELFYCNNLHAKCYHNEESLVITSMNLHESSERNNREMGVHFTLAEDPVIFKAALTEIDSIIHSSILMKGLDLQKRYIVPDVFDGTDVFHLKSLHNFLKDDFQHYAWELSESELTVTDFPIKGVNTFISRRILFQFQSAAQLYKCKTRLEQTAQRGNYRIYPKRDLVYIYPEEGFAVEDSKEGLIEKTDYFRKMALDFCKSHIFTV